jgi:putative (di)nucleoside polyphosphate hydrolase
MIPAEAIVYRPNVAAILQRADGRVLIGQRSDFPESWQLPQGGLDPLLTTASGRLTTS